MDRHNGLLIKYGNHIMNNLSNEAYDFARQQVKAKKCVIVLCYDEGEFYTLQMGLVNDGKVRTEIAQFYPDGTHHTFKKAS